MLLCKAEIHDENSAVLLAQNKVRSLDITMDEASVMYLLNGYQHLQQDVNRDFETVGLLQTSPSTRQINAQEVHHNQILLRILNEVIYACDVFEA